MIEPCRGSLAAPGRLVRIERRIAGDGQNIAMVRVHHHHAAAFGMRGLDRAGDGVLSRQLDALIDAEGQVGAGPRFGFQVGIDAAPFSVGENANAARQAAQVGLQTPFEAPLAGLFAIDGSDDVRGQGISRIVPAALIGESDPIQVQAAQPFVLLRCDSARHPHETSLVGGVPLHAAIERRPVDLQHSRQNVGS